MHSLQLHSVFVVAAFELSACVIIETHGTRCRMLLGLQKVNPPNDDCDTMRTYSQTTTSIPWPS